MKRNATITPVSERSGPFGCVIAALCIRSRRDYVPSRMTEFTFVARPAVRAARLTFSRPQRLRLAAFYGCIGVLHVLGWGLYLHYAAQFPQLVGLGFVAYMFGLRHAFDADHIAAVDDSVRF